MPNPLSVQTTLGSRTKAVDDRVAVREDNANKTVVLVVDNLLSIAGHDSLAWSEVLRIEDSWS